jgi:hypothetical protein
VLKRASSRLLASDRLQMITDVFSANAAAEELVASAVIVLYLGWAWSVSAPANSFLSRAAVRLTGSASIWSGLWHSWEMYTPYPSQSSLYLSAVLTYEGGMSDFWQAPAVGHMHPLQGFLLMRFSRYEDSISNSDFESFRPGLCAYLARHVADSSRILAAIDLVCDYVPIKPPFGEQPDESLVPQQEVLHSTQFSLPGENALS